MPAARQNVAIAENVEGACANYQTSQRAGAAQFRGSIVLIPAGGTQRDGRRLDLLIDRHITNRDGSIS
ncbi:MAG: hypothetical protein DMG69_21350 [Acidobacteria bacterium]|nr:MAG: hypothetical protein DMG69_21350 [Acidobacteriota bacterium]